MWITGSLLKKTRYRCQDLELENIYSWSESMAEGCSELPSVSPGVQFLGVVGTWCVASR